eukprot:CAMPEP_0118962700 /NCGR_PEP_ID=MMETSP1173-20130426/939_1 /TAXON_ID=1034831 /ORGANISM="Rhizochromulina marina cf, Strain CCMP1243" /LENGTH=218 /DNA_ID=CAMNT_0006910989 /DNA_START=39 /DNA_END=693 /DNA_ORIENTATION=-
MFSRAVLRTASRTVASAPAVVAGPRVAQVAAARQLPFVAIRAFGAESFLDKKEVTERIMMVVSNFEKVDTSKVNPEAKFKDDLDLDSLDAVEVVLGIEEEFALEIPDAEADKILSVADAVEYIANHPQAKRNPSEGTFCKSLAVESPGALVARRKLKQRRGRFKRRALDSVPEGGGAWIFDVAEAERNPMFIMITGMNEPAHVLLGVQQQHAQGAGGG